MKMAIASDSPITAPTSASGGRAGAAGGDGGALARTGRGAATIGAGGRRDGRKIGRSRVAGSIDSGSAQSGLPLGGTGAARGLSVVMISIGGAAKLPAGRSTPVGAAAKTRWVAATARIPVKPARKRLRRTVIVPHLAIVR